MAIDTDLITLLAAEASINSLLSTTTSFYTDKTDQNGEMPYVVVTQLDEDPLLMLSGTTGLAIAEIDIDCVASSRVTANAVFAAVKAYIKDYSGAAGASTVRAVLLNGLATDAIPIGQGTENYKFVKTLNLQVQYE